MEKVKDTLEEERRKYRSEAERYKVEAEKLKKVEILYTETCSAAEELTRKNFEYECELEELRRKAEQ